LTNSDLKKSRKKLYHSCANTNVRFIEAMYDEAKENIYIIMALMKDGTFEKYI